VPPAHRQAGLDSWPREGEKYLPEVVVGPNETFEQALKRFNKMVQQAGVLAEARRREHYEPPSVRAKKKRAAKLRKSRKTSRNNSRY
jgi:small subunit ribosomal protein S21